MQSIADELAGVALGDPVHFGNMTLFPLLRRAVSDRGADYLLLEDAVAQGAARVTETGGGGSVPELLFENRGDKPILLLDGEELVGAKQNRALNLTVLAPANQTITIPVSCVEAGRWHMHSPEFRPAAHMMYGRARAARAAQVTVSMAEGGAPRSDQAAVWREIDHKAARLSACSTTRAMSAIYERQAISVEAYVRAFSWKDGQAGSLYAIGEALMGLDLLDRPESMRRLMPRLVRSYALDALDAPAARAAGPERASGFLASVAEARNVIRPATGLGKDVRLTGGSVSGAALWAEERYVHLCAFGVNGNGGSGTLPGAFLSPARRRGRA